MDAKSLPKNGEHGGVLPSESETMGVWSKVMVRNSGDQRGSAENCREKTSMKHIKRGIFGAIVLIAVSTDQLYAVEGTKIAVVCPDVVLTWPSSPGQSFLVQHRPTLNADTPWANLTNQFLGRFGTNSTIFFHFNQMDCGSGDALASFGGDSESLATSEAALADLPPMPLVMRADIPSSAVPIDLYPPGFDLTGFLIFHPIAGETVSGSGYTTKPFFSETQSDGIEPTGGETDGPEDAGGSVTSMGFYRVFDVTPVAHDDMFAVEQYSSANQLNIFNNDSDPNDDRFLIASLIPAQHGDIEYTLDASTFQYTPETDFWGIDSFGYTITNRHGSFATATVTVFVNQSGNQAPSASDLSTTLETNVYAFVFNALTNSYDPETDLLTLFAVNAPQLGTVTTNSAGDITYTRNPDLFGRDTFRYIVTDGKGGRAVGNVVILQVDSDGDGMPDAWEMRNGLDLMSNESADDPDSDGLPNLGEFKLHTAPQSPDNPLNLAITNGTQVSGHAQMTVQGLSYTVGNQPITLYVNGTPAANSFLSVGPDGRWLVNWNTTFLPNGTYTVKLGFQYNADVSFGAQSVVFGGEKTVEIANIIRFDPLTSQFTDFLLIDGFLTVQNATVRIDLYDEDDNPLVYGNVTTTNGEIHLYWDLTDGQGNQLAFSHVHGRFQITPAGGMSANGPTQDGPGDNPDPNTALQWFLKERTQGIGNTFVSAWGWNEYTLAFNNQTEQMMLNGVINILGNPADFNSYFLAPNLNFPYTSTFRFDNDADKKVLLDSLKQYQNFFWLGHGGYNAILANEDRASIGPADIEEILQNLAYKSSEKRPREDKHPYRLVILNGCETYSSLWSGAFGIPFSSEGSTNFVLDYQFTGRMPRAFVGWTNTVELPFGLDVGGAAHTAYGEALGQLFSKWMAGYPLEYCLDFFADKADEHDFDGHDSWRISGCVDLTRW